MSLSVVIGEGLKEIPEIIGVLNSALHVPDSKCRLRIFRERHKTRDRFIQQKKQKE
jgi:hypothetical protein